MSLLEGSGKRVRHQCPNCEGKLVRRPACYHWRGVTMHGWVCVPCNSLVDVRGAFLRYVNKVSGKTKAG
jgi:ribosomal protein L37AE/L43A